jgi:choline dehydrogenase
VDNIIHDGKRQSAYRSYVYPLLKQSNFTVLTGALTTRILFESSRATGIEFEYQGHLHWANATLEIVLSQGAIQTPKLLMQSGIGDAVEWTPKMRQANKTHFSANGELCHGSESTEVHAGV